jgi:hypothetical protein
MLRLSRMNLSSEIAVLVECDMSRQQWFMTWQLLWTILVNPAPTASSFVIVAVKSLHWQWRVNALDFPWQVFPVGGCAVGAGVPFLDEFLFQCLQFWLEFSHRSFLKAFNHSRPLPLSV